jgi:phosphatidate phosphatase APP1
MFPKRRFILVGDSGEKDPEIYGALARSQPGRIVGIFIRDVTGDAAARYEAAFRGVPRETWAVFKDPAEVQGKASALVK